MTVKKKEEIGKRFVITDEGIELRSSRNGKGLVIVRQYGPSPWLLDGTDKEGSNESLLSAPILVYSMNGSYGENLLDILAELVILRDEKVKKAAAIENLERMLAEQRAKTAVYAMPLLKFIAAKLKGKI